jgi:hypothetical protein
VTDLRAALERLAAGLDWHEGDRVMRIASALEGKADPAGYWRYRGRQRFTRELAADGLDDPLVASVLEVVDELLSPEVDLDAVLRDLTRRYG